MSETRENQNRPSGAGGDAPAPVRWTEERVLDVHFWTPRLLSFRISRPAAFRFSAGHYARLGLMDAGGETVWRPLSMVSAPGEDCLEFVVALVPDGAFSTLAATLAPGAALRLDKSCFGFLTLDQLAPGRDLWLLASGTGIGPFVSLMRSPETWQAFAHPVLVHSVRHAAELVYRPELERLAAQSALRYFPVVTRDIPPAALAARIPQLLADGRLEKAAGLNLEAATGRIMVCGNPDLARELRAWLTARGFATSRRGLLGTMAFEKYW